MFIEEKEMKNYHLVVNGHPLDVQFDEDNIQNIFIPLLKKWTKMQKEKNQRLLVLLAAPPGCGKTTTSLFLEYLSHHIEGITPIQSIGMDGFHRYQDYLDNHYIVRDEKHILMKDVKGCPETFDVDKFIDKIKETKVKDTYWPLYNRAIHNPEENQIFVDSSIVLIEGNYLLLDEEPWKHIHELFDDSIFIEANPIELQKRLVSRKMLGGVPYHQAYQFYLNSDGVNVLRVLNHSLKANTHLTMKNNRFEVMNNDCLFNK